MTGGFDPCETEKRSEAGLGLAFRLVMFDCCWSLKKKVILGNHLAM